MLKGRLGLATARIPQADRHGVMWLGRGNVVVEDGTLRFVTAGFDELPAGDYAIPYQMVSCLLLQPGTTVSHDALRILANHGTGVVAAGEGGVRFYASMPFGPDRSARARRQVELWAEPSERTRIIQQMYAQRLGEQLNVTDLNALRGIEGARVKASYQRLAQAFGLAWRGRRYDRTEAEAADVANQALNHASSALRAAAMVAVAVTGTIPQLGFIHEDSGIAFALDIADLFRESVMLPVAFGAARAIEEGSDDTVDRLVRRIAGQAFRSQDVIPTMIDRIKGFIDVDDGSGDS